MIWILLPLGAALLVGVTVMLFEHEDGDSIPKTLRTLVVFTLLFWPLLIAGLLDAAAEKFSTHRERREVEKR